MRSSSIIIAEAKIFSVSPDPIGVESSLWIAGMVCVIAGIASRLIDRFTECSLMPARRQSRRSCQNSRFTAHLDGVEQGNVPLNGYEILPYSLRDM